MTRTTSADVYRQIQDEGLISVRQLQVYESLYEDGPMTQAESLHWILTQRSSEFTRTTKPSISPRFAELAKLGAIHSVGKRPCSITGYNCLIWDVTDKLPVKPKKEHPYPSDHLYPLFKHMNNNHNLTLLESELWDIVKAVEKCKK